MKELNIKRRESLNIIEFMFKADWCEPTISEEVDFCDATDKELVAVALDFFKISAGEVAIKVDFEIYFDSSDPANWVAKEVRVYANDDVYSDSTVLGVTLVAKTSKNMAPDFGDHWIKSDGRRSDSPIWAIELLLNELARLSTCSEMDGWEG